MVRHVGVKIISSYSVWVLLGGWISAEECWSLWWHHIQSLCCGFDFFIISNCV